MSLAQAIIRQAGATGVKLAASGGMIRFEAPGRLPDDVRAALIEHKNEVLALLESRAEVLSRRWGPAMDDSEPGIEIITPDRERMMAAVAALGIGPGDAREERL